MYYEPTELRLARSAASLHAQAKPKTAANVSVLDEAFASVSDADFRRDASHRATPEATQTTDLTIGLRQQFKALEGQQRELTKLLAGLG